MYQSENGRLKFEEVMRELLPAEKMAREYASLANAVVLVLETQPDILEREGALPPKAVQVVQNQVDDHPG